MMRRVLLLCGLLLACPPGAAAQARDTTLDSAETAARAWLAQLDRSRYDSAYARVAGAMRSEVGLEEWTASMRALRAVLPPDSPRERLRAEHGTQLFGAPSVLLTLGIARTPWKEIVVLVRDRTGWRVGGYGVLY